jgi:hypothetical protein
VRIDQIIAPFKDGAACIQPDAHVSHRFPGDTVCPADAASELIHTNLAVVTTHHPAGNHGLIERALGLFDRCPPMSVVAGRRRRRDVTMKFIALYPSPFSRAYFRPSAFRDTLAWAGQLSRLSSTCDSTLLVATRGIVHLPDNFQGCPALATRRWW